MLVIFKGGVGYRPPLGHLGKRMFAQAWPSLPSNLFTFIAFHTSAFFSFCPESFLFLPASFR